jgi:hypothetical protein
MDQSLNVQNRRSRRSPVLLAATVEIDGIPVTVKLRNLSEKGALIEGERLPSEQAETFFERNDMRLKSRVVWVQGNFAGVAFDIALKREEVLRHIPAPKPRLDFGFRRPGLSSRPLTAYERSMISTWIATAQENLIDD